MTELAITNLRKTGGRAASGVSISYDLSAPAAVTARVLTLSGKVTATIAKGRASDSGENTLRWDGRGREGDSLPAGPYVVEINARGDGGEVATQRVPVLILR